MLCQSLGQLPPHAPHIPHRKALEEAAPDTDSFGYPSAIQTRNGRIHITYSVRTKAGGNIRHAEFDPGWVESATP